METVNNISFDVESSVSKNLIQLVPWFPTSGKVLKSFLRCSSWVTILKFGFNKIFQFFLRFTDQFFIDKVILEKGERQEKAPIFLENTEIVMSTMLLEKWT